MKSYISGLIFLIFWIVFGFSMVFHGMESVAEETVDDDYTANGWSAGLAITTIILEKGTVIQIRDDGELTTTGQVLFSIRMPDGSTAFEIVVPPPVDPTLEECPYIIYNWVMPINDYPRWHGEKCTHGLRDPMWDFVTTGTLYMTYSDMIDLDPDDIRIDLSGDLKVIGE